MFDEPQLFPARNPAMFEGLRPACRVSAPTFYGTRIRNWTLFAKPTRRE
jgi:hypothetical protein